MAYRLYMMEEGTARKVRPILRWVKDNFPRKRERGEAASLLRKIEGIREHKQISMSKGEAELLVFIYQEFPDVTFKPKQLGLGLEEDTVIDKVPKGKKLKDRPVLPSTLSRAREKTSLKATLTKSDQEARRSAGLSLLPGSEPTDAEGVPLSKRIEESREKIDAQNRNFGKRKEEITENPDD